MLDLERRIDLLGDAARHDICRGCGTHSNRVRDDMDRWIYPAVRPDGKRVSLLKVLQTNVCENDCRYCANRSGRDTPRASFSPDELAALFGSLVQRGRVEGLFLSSGICGRSGQAMERMLATVDLVRHRHDFHGYVHLKILPGAEDAAIEAAVALADRVSVNLEAPNKERLARLTHTKDMARQLLYPLGRAAVLRDAVAHPVSMTTQFVVGAAGESDRELLQSAHHLYGKVGLSRVYYSAFQPVADTPLEDAPATPTWREHRLYQADFLLRKYGFGFGELVFDANGHLPRRYDPKQAWALIHPEVFPIEVNTAAEELLLRVPGIGPISARRLVDWRRRGTLTELRQLRQAGASSERAAPFVLLNGQRPCYQMALWPLVA
jgi:predicted DNA-binding helix-hairpin-helix protein